MTERGLTVVIPVRDNAEHLVQQLDAVHAAMRGQPDVELLVVDNGSTDGSPDVVRRWARERGASVSVVPAPERAGEPYARNVGVAAASHELIAFCDGDDVVAPTWIAGMREALGHDAYVTGPVSTDALNPPWLQRVRGAVFDRPTALAGVVPYAHGCNMGFRRDALVDLGGFDESLPIGCDIDIAIRAWKAGMSLAWEEKALVHYRLRADLGAMYRQGRGYGRARRRLRAQLPVDADARSEGVANARRVAWLLRSLPFVVRDRERRARFVWVLAQLDGELRAVLRGDR